MYPLPRIMTFLICSMEPSGSVHWMVQVSLSNRVKTALTAGSGLWQFTLMLFKFYNASATFKRLIETVLCELIGKICLVYLGDVIVFVLTVDELLRRLCVMFVKSREARVSPKKC